MSILPARLQALCVQALEALSDSAARKEIRSLADCVATTTWQHWQKWRTAEDNRPEHEWVVFANILRIAEDERLSLSDLRVATTFAFFHDACFIPRITEVMIRTAPDESTRRQLQADKERQRLQHMQRGAANARFLLPQLSLPGPMNRPILTPEEIERCAQLIAQHDLWKLGEPSPAGDDRLAVACLEGDALWPLHPLGVLADLERPDEHGQIRDVGQPAVWRTQLQHSLTTLLEYRRNWQHLPGEVFLDAESIFRTRAGHRLYRQWRELWNV